MCLKFRELPSSRLATGEHRRGYIHRNVTRNDSNDILPLTDRQHLKITFTEVWRVKSLRSSFYASSLPAALSLEADCSVRGELQGLQQRSGGQSDSAVTHQWNAPSFTLIHVVQQRCSFLHAPNRRFCFTSTSKCRKLMQKYGHYCIITVSYKVAGGSDLNMNLNKCEDQIFVQEVNLVHAAAQNIFYDADVGRMHEYRSLCWNFTKYQ